MRSDLMKGGPSRAPQRSLLRALGLSDTELTRPFIGVVCSKSDYIPGHKHLGEIAEAVKNSAYEIINRKHATYYGIAMSVKRICEVIMRNEKSILPVSHIIHGVYDIDGVSLSMPVIVGVDGIESNIPINLSGEEALKLKKSADSLKKIIETIEL